MRKNPVAAVLVTAAAAAALTACGSGGDEGLAGESATTIQKKAVKAMRSAKSMSVDAKVESDGQQMAIDLTLSKDGDCKGSISVDGATAEVLRTGSESYMKPDDKFWEMSTSPSQAEQIKQLVGDRWVTTSGKDEFAAFCDLEKLLADMDENNGKASKGETTTVAGTETIPVIEKKGKETDTGWVATEGKPYVLKTVSEGGDDPGTATFSDFDEKVDVQAPPSSETVDLSKVAG